jgi:putative glycosyltransferase (TIGR04372 family)
MLKLFFYIVAPIILLFVILLYPIILIRFCFLPSHRIGEFVEFSEIYLLNKEYKVNIPNKRFFDIFITTHIISNKTYLNLLKSKMTVLDGKIAYPIYRIINVISKKFIFFKKFLILKQNLDHSIQYNKKNIQICLKKEFIDKGDKFLEKIGIERNSKIICLLVRNNDYLNKNFPKNDWNYHSYRNCKIENYIEAINLAMERGYYVFKMGATPGHSLNINNSRFIDYAKHYRNDFMDVYLASKCEFSISSGTGWDALTSWTFRKPHIWTNAVPIIWPALNPSNKLIFSIKLHFDKKKDRFLSLKEILNSELFMSSSSDAFYKKDVMLYENDSDDIKNMMLEMIDNLENRDFASEENLITHKKIQNIYKKNLKLPKGEFRIFDVKLSESFVKKHDFLLRE